MKKTTIFFLLPALLFLTSTLSAQTATPASDGDRGRTTVSFTVPEKDLLPENIAYDRKTGSSYIGSTRHGKIIRVDGHGEVSDFVPAGRDGLWQVIGMKIDEKRRVLWVCSSSGENLIGYRKSDTNPAGIFKYDLETGRLLRKFVLDGKGERHFFNDLTLSREGDVFITHMFEPAAVYRIGRDSDRLEVFLRPERFVNPNGIAISPDDRTLYIAHQFGVKTLDLNNRELGNLQYPEDVSMKGIDGLYFYRDSLIAVHPGRNMVARYYLDETGRSVTRGEVLEADHPLFNVPTTGVIVGSGFYFIANSQFASFDRDGKLFPPEKLSETVILRIELAPEKLRDEGKKTSRSSQDEAVEALKKLGGTVGFDPSGAKVVKVDLHKTPVSDADLKLLESFPDLEWLDLRLNAIGDPGVEHLKNLRKLKFLNLFRSKLSDRGLGYLKDLTELETLLIGGTLVTDTGLKHIENFSRLKKLSLFETAVSDAGLKHIENLKKLETFFFSGSAITEKGARDLQKTLPALRFTEN
ncbi:MAG: SMP-30/gluconolactonase/LRE family protein [Pyrinomonadaceae bacterium]